jgi:hypothetical protein
VLPQPSLICIVAERLRRQSSVPALCLQLQMRRSTTSASRRANEEAGKSWAQDRHRSRS